MNSIRLLVLLAAIVSIGTLGMRGNVGQPRPRLNPSIASTAPAVTGEPVPSDAPPRSNTSLPGADAEGSGSVMRLPPFIVWGPRPLKEREVIKENKHFTFVQGGTLFEHKGSVFTIEIKLQYNPERNFIEFLSISW